MQSGKVGGQNLSNMAKGRERGRRAPFLRSPAAGPSPGRAVAEMKLEDLPKAGTWTAKMKGKCNYYHCFSNTNLSRQPDTI
ncbi:hypothetical protein MUG91_G88n17 [Manis pentadactyla]|nr:hypothetical protein MUG91_G88n17 [Manis pentadactyla]